MRIQQKFYCVAATLMVLMAYMGGIAFSQLPDCEEGCKRVTAYNTHGGTSCLAFRFPNCFTADMWVDGPEKDSYGDPYPRCTRAYEDGTKMNVFSCQNCTKVCGNTGSGDLQEMYKADPHQNCGDPTSQADRRSCHH